MMMIRIRVHRLTDFRLHPNQKQEKKSDGTKTGTEPKTVIFKRTKTGTGAKHQRKGNINV